MWLNILKDLATQYLILYPYPPDYVSSVQKWTVTYKLEENDIKPNFCMAKELPC